LDEFARRFRTIQDSRKQGGDRQSGVRTTRRSAAFSEVVRDGKSKSLTQNSH
jgi:hypothetical protein